MLKANKAYDLEIIGVGSYLPERVISNDYLSTLMDTSHQWINARTGINSRRFAKKSESTSDLAVSSVKAALKDAQISADMLDLIIVSTITPDYYMPGIGVMIQDKIGARDVQSLDIKGQCAGFSWALATADAYAQLGKYKYILVVGADLQSRILDFSTAGRNTAVLFGDGAGSVVMHVSKSDAKTAYKKSRLIDHELGSQGSGVESLCVKRPGMAAGYDEFLTEDDVKNKSFSVVMNGKLVFKNAIYYMQRTLNTILKNNNLTIDDIDLVLPHQANFRINEMLRHKLNMPSEKWVNVIDITGNTTSATIPLCMSRAIEDKRLTKGKLVVTVAFGSGFTWGANLIRF